MYLEQQNGFLVKFRADRLVQRSTCFKKFYAKKQIFRLKK